MRPRSPRCQRGSTRAALGLMHRDPPDNCPSRSSGESICASTSEIRRHQLRDDRRLAGHEVVLQLQCSVSGSRRTGLWGVSPIEIERAVTADRLDTLGDGLSRDQIHPRLRSGRSSLIVARQLRPPPRSRRSRMFSSAARSEPFNARSPVSRQPGTAERDIEHLPAGSRDDTVDHGHSQV